ncbi:MAG: organic hydroperoxide resistance protein [Chloroflexia bacterium]|nr:organic hydroperoxide resistance protein [Chloroflexia bacterium]
MAIQPIDPVYTARATVTGGRQGHVTSSDEVLDFELRPPGSNGEVLATNPEQLFAAGYAACFQSALMSAAKLAEEDASRSSVAAEVSLGKDATGLFGLSVTLTVTIPGMDRESVLTLTEAAHKRCPYSRATHGNIDVQLRVGE